MFVNKILTLVIMLSALSPEINTTSTNIVINNQSGFEIEESSFHLDPAWKPLIEEALLDYYYTLEELYPEGFNYKLNAATADLGTDGIPEILVSVVYDFMYTAGGTMAGTLQTCEIFSIFYLDTQSHRIERYEMPYNANEVQGLAYPHGLYILYPPGNLYRVSFQDGELYDGEFVFAGDTLYLENHRTLYHPDTAQRINITQTEEDNAEYFLYLNQAQTWNNIATPINSPEDIEPFINTVIYLSNKTPEPAQNSVKTHL